MDPNIVYCIPFRGTTLHIEYAPIPGDIRDYRGLLPGVGSRESSILGALQQVIAMWKHIGKPLPYRWCGKEPTCITTEELLSFAKPWERAHILSMLQGPTPL